MMKVQGRGGGTSGAVAGGIVEEGGGMRGCKRLVGQISEGGRRWDGSWVGELAC